jgi:dihydrolipoamide dehydrogenase
MEQFDVAILGGGPAGYPAAVRGAQLGGRICVIERERLGGVCLNWGCIPTKTFVAAADVLRKCRRAGEFGIAIDGTVRFELEKLIARKDKIVEDLVKGVHGLFKSWRITLVEGNGVLESKDTVRVSKKDGSTLEVRARNILIATGSRPAAIPIFPIDERTILSSDGALSISEIPGSILIVGAGVIGCEFACIFSEFGSKVTMVEMLERALPLEDEDMSKGIERELRKKKIRVVTGTKVASVKESPEGRKVATIETGEEIVTDRILVSIGRTPNSDGIGLETIGVETGRGRAILVNKKMETNVKGVYAAGDVIGGLMLAHVATAEGLIAVENAVTGKGREISYRTVPSGIFTDPEIGTVGLKEKEAREKGIPVKVGRFLYRLLGKSHAIGEIAGEVKLIADASTDVVLGAHILGAHATDIVHEAALAVELGAKTQELADMIHAHPTLSEALQEAAHDVHGLAIHTPPKK